MKKNERRAKLYHNTKGSYFIVDKVRIYMNEVLRSDSNDYIGVYILNNCIAIYVIKIIYDIEDSVIYTYSFL